MEDITRQLNKLDIRFEDTKHEEIVRCSQICLKDFRSEQLADQERACIGMRYINIFRGLLLKNDKHSNSCKQ